MRRQLTGVRLRYYEQQGPIRPSWQAHGYRMYAENDVRIVRLIRAIGELVESRRALDLAIDAAPKPRYLPGT